MKNANPTIVLTKVNHKEKIKKSWNLRFFSLKKDLNYRKTFGHAHKKQEALENEIIIS